MNTTDNMIMASIRNGKKVSYFRAHRHHKCHNRKDYENFIPISVKKYINRQIPKNNQQKRFLKKHIYQTHIRN